MFYYRINGTLCCSLNGELDFPREELYGRGTDEKRPEKRRPARRNWYFCLSVLLKTAALPSA